MSGITNSDNGMMENQQADDLGHAVGQGDAPGVQAASVESPTPGLQAPVDAGGFLPERDAIPDQPTEDARQAALARAEAQPHPRH